MMEPETTWRNPHTGATMTIIEDKTALSVIEWLMRPRTGRTDDL